MAQRTKTAGCDTLTVGLDQHIRFDEKNTNKTDLYILYTRLNDKDDLCWDLEGLA